MGKYKVIEYSTEINDPRAYEALYTFKVVGGDITGNGVKEIKDAIENIGGYEWCSIPVNIPKDVNWQEAYTRNALMLCGRHNGKTSYMMSMLRTVMEYKFYPVKVIFHDPATIVFWDDGSKTVVKCQKDDTYNEEMGLALCFAKKAMGNKSNFNNVFKKWIPEDQNYGRATTN